MHKLGATRSSHQQSHLLQTPDTFVRTPLPGLAAASAVVHISPAGGAQFTQYSAELEPGGTLASPSIPAQRFLYVVAGAAELLIGRETHPLHSGSYAYLPAGADAVISAQEPAVLAVIEKTYHALPGVSVPALFIGQEQSLPSTALLGDTGIQVRSLLPDHIAFDFAVNTMTYQPGSALGMVEVHVMEHGLLMLEGGGIYRLGNSWYPVAAGDFIWMAPFCPQWFGALGKQPAKYLIYKDWNRLSPL